MKARAAEPSQVRKRSREAILRRRCAELLVSARHNLEACRGHALPLLSPATAALWRYAFERAEGLLEPAEALGGAHEKWTVCGNLEPATGALLACTTVPEDWCIGALGEAAWRIGVAAGLLEASAIHNIARSKPKGKAAVTLRIEQLLGAHPDETHKQIQDRLEREGWSAPSTQRISTVARAAGLTAAVRRKRQSL